ncbi:hypothetical protein DYB30_013158 [Aphanomyces astaci]|uniref:Uncharacterized protein n=1 Tax=Aphanomyces astaci TaxID=112090 RepID=A0A397E773_APHAT|nr:hypothetical protein DYB30_013158 [Aphanomyces astaci]
MWTRGEGTWDDDDDTAPVYLPRWADCGERITEKCNPAPVYLPRWADCGERITEKCNPEDVCKEYHEGSGKLQCTMQRNSNFFENGASKYDDCTQPYLGECSR